MADPKSLDIFIGRWATTGSFVAPKPGEPETMTATDDYEWLPGGTHILHKAQAHMGGGAPNFTTEIMGYTPDGELKTWAFNGDGSVSTYTARLDSHSWQIDGDTERFRGQFSADGNTLSGRWEQRDGDNWTAWLDIELQKQG